MGASLIKSSSDKKAAQKQANQQYSNDQAAAQQQRDWYLADRAEERTYNRSQEEEARAYDRAQLEETRTYSRQVLGNLVEDAEAAGFNPLTVMRSGGASSYNSAAGLAPLSASRLTSSPAQMQQAPVRQAVGGSVGGSFAGAVGDFLNNFDPFADQKKEQEYRLVESQIAALNASALSGVARGAGSFASGDFDRRPTRQAGVLGKVAAPDIGKVNVTNPWQIGEVASNQRDAAAYEERYGEFGGSVMGGFVAARDWLHNWGRVIDGAGPIVNNVRNATTKPAASWVIKNVTDAYGRLTSPKSKPKKIDNFDDPFPPWAW